MRVLLCLILVVPLSTFAQSGQDSVVKRRADLGFYVDPVSELIQQKLTFEEYLQIANQRRIKAQTLNACKNTELIQKISLRNDYLLNDFSQDVKLYEFSRQAYDGQKMIARAQIIAWGIAPAAAAPSMVRAISAIMSSGTWAVERPFMKFITGRALPEGASELWPIEKVAGSIMYASGLGLAALHFGHKLSVDEKDSEFLQINLSKMIDNNTDLEATIKNFDMAFKENQKEIEKNYRQRLKDYYLAGAVEQGLLKANLDLKYVSLTHEKIVLLTLLNLQKLRFNLALEQVLVNQNCH